MGVTRPPSGDRGRALHLGERGAQRAAAAVVQAVDRRLGAAEAAGDLAGGEADEVAHARRPGAAPRAASRARRAGRASAGATTRRRRCGSRARGPPRRGSRGAGACGRPRRCARRGGSRPRTAPRAARTSASTVISFANTCCVTSSASWSSRTMLRDVAVDVVGVADVEEAERLAVALLGARDGLRDDPARGRRPRRAWCWAEAPCGPGGAQLVGARAERVDHVCLPSMFVR